MKFHSRDSFRIAMVGSRWTVAATIEILVIKVLSPFYRALHFLVVFLCGIVSRFILGFHCRERSRFSIYLQSIVYIATLFVEDNWSIRTYV